MYRAFFLFAIMFFLLGMGCQQQPHKRSISTNTSLPPGQLHYDRLAAGHEVDGDQAAEAREWLDSKNTQNVLWKTTRAETLQYVEQLYQAGAVKVYAVYAPRDGAVPVNICAELLIELPKDELARKKVIRVYNRIDNEIWGPDHEPFKDDSRRYLELSMDS